MPWQQVTPMSEKKEFIGLAVETYGPLSPGIFATISSSGNQSAACFPDGLKRGCRLPGRRREGAQKAPVLAGDFLPPGPPTSSWYRPQFYRKIA